MSYQENPANDYAIVLELYYRVIKICSLVADDIELEFEESFYHQNLDNAKAVDRSYILLVHELEKIYARDKSLAAINDNPSTRAIWTRFDTIEHNSVAVSDYAGGYKNSEDFAHHAAVNRFVPL